MQKETQRMIEKEAREKQQQAQEEQLEKKFTKMTSTMTGKGSALANQRILKDYVSLLKSDEFKGKMEVDFAGDNMYVWRVRFDL